MDKLSGLKKKLSVSMKEHHGHGIHTNESENYEKDDAASNGNTPTLPIENTASFVTQYLGFVEIKSPGLDEICENVDKMYTQAKPFMKTLEKTTLKINKEGIEIGPKNEEIESKLFKFRRILYCGVDKQHRRVFSFNYQYGSRAENIHLHVIVCKTKEDAKNLAKKLAEIFREISIELHKKEKEDKRRHSENLSRSRGSSKSEPNMSNRLVKSDSNYSSSGASEVGSPGSPPSCGSDGMWECGAMTRRPPVCS
eukprot:Seg1981.2 transcript_id=Seg1981.2/GoldUCD/mRNA.D3Y31 product="Low density lipoprotein receptor adapter protein 1" protein_id=Seg1981.2/GoldUCD/D3Y31